MKCFNHPQIEAIGICKNCSKGLCQECYVEQTDGISCKGRCEKMVKKVNVLFERNIETSYVMTGNLSVAAGIVLFLLGLFTLISTSSFQSLLIIFLGGILFTFGLSRRKMGDV